MHRLVEVTLRLTAGAPGLGLTIVGGSESHYGERSIFVKRVIVGSLADKDRKIKSGDELIAVNETLLTGVTKEYAL